MSDTLSTERFFLNLLSPDVHFDLYYALREPSWEAWRVGDRSPNTYHLIYFPLFSPIKGVIAGEAVRVAPSQSLWVQPEETFTLEKAEPASNFGLEVCRFSLGGHTPVRLGVPFLIGHQDEGRSPLRALLPGNETQDTLEEFRKRSQLCAMLIQSFFGTSGRLGNPQSDELPSAFRHEILTYLRSNIHRRITAHDLAKHLRMNPRHLSRRFKKTFGTSPRRMILELRLKTAGSILRSSSEPIGTLAARLGYPDTFLFSRQFKTFFGVTPTQWRQEG